VDPFPDPLLLRKSGSAGNRTRDLWVCSDSVKYIHYIFPISFYAMDQDDTVGRLLARPEFDSLLRQEIIRYSASSHRLAAYPVGTGEVSWRVKQGELDAGH
jgi:hypothetical protein